MRERERERERQRGRDRETHGQIETERWEKAELYLSSLVF